MKMLTARRYLLGAACLLAGCSNMSYPRTEIGIFDQCIKADLWGIYYLSPYGPVGLGRGLWERNVACDKDIKQTPMPDLSQGKTIGRMILTPGTNSLNLPSYDVPAVRIVPQPDGTTKVEAIQ